MGIAGANAAPVDCLHCRQPVPAARADAYCCSGCRAVHRALRDQGLLRYYDLSAGVGVPVGELSLERRDQRWLDAFAAKLRESAGAEPLRLRVQGLHCAACVWVIEQLFRRRSSAGEVIVNPTRGTLSVRAQPDFDLAGFVQDVEAVGYLVGPPDARTEPGRDELLLRTGICAALAANSMMFSAALYLGLGTGPLFEFLRSLNFAAAMLTVLVGSPVFFRSAWQALRRGAAHLDLPIAVGIALTTGAAVWSYASSNHAAAYHDSLAVFVALMLVGRLLQERVLERNRARLLSSPDLDALEVRVIRAGVVAPQPATRVLEGDELLVAPGDLFVVPGRLLDRHASCSLDWVNGESAPVQYAEADRIAAGAFNIGAEAVRVRAACAFGQSPLEALLRAPHERKSESQSTVASAFSWAYVAGVLALGAGGMAYWALGRGLFVHGLEVATAVFVVTCPCAIGIAVPLARELVHARLRAHGVFVRRLDLLDRALAVRRVVFDKTGTLTTGVLELDDPRALDTLDDADRCALGAMVSRSLHPWSVAIRRALDPRCLRFDPGSQVTELAGQGLSMLSAGHHYRLGKGAFAGAAPGDHEGGAVHFVRDGVVLARIGAHEALRPDARREVDALRADGYETWILSGDAQARVSAMAGALGHPPERSLGALSPQDKARWIAQHDHADTLMVGDGINDSLAVQHAHCSATPSIDRSFMPSRSDFYFVTPGIEPIRAVLRLARRERSVIRRNLIAALLYNAGTVAIALTGNMQPWVAALVMPASSLFVVGMTLGSLSERRTRPWTS